MQNNAAKGNPSVKNCPEKSGRKPIIVKAANAQNKNIPQQNARI
jgi:hypothetical protein